LAERAARRNLQEKGKEATMRGLGGKSAIVTGAGNGIGAAIAQRLAAEGVRVLVADIRAERAKNTVETIRESGGQAEPCAMDVRERDDAAGAVRQAVDHFGRLDILICNAGLMDREPFLDMTDDLWHRVIDTNLYGTFICAQAAARQMVAQGGGGRIVTVASNSGIFGGIGRAAYGASKAGIMNLTQSMAMELAPHAINVNAVAPGPTRTGANPSGKPSDYIRIRMPLARLGEPSEIAAVAAFLASDDASFVTGHVYAADGGFTIAGMIDT
jgi:3-oxoacyl-[acyl-carrier protein] reductase